MSGPPPGGGPLSFWERPTAPTIGVEEAERRTRAVQIKLAEAWRELLALYEAGAHFALGYPSWGAYAAERFGVRSATAYRLLAAGRAARVLDDAGLPVPRTQQMAQLVGSQPDPAGAWRAVIEAHGERATVAQARTLLASATPLPAGPRLLPREEARAILLHDLGEIQTALDAARPAFEANDADGLLRAADKLDEIDRRRLYDAECSTLAWWGQDAGEEILRWVPWGDPRASELLRKYEEQVVAGGQRGRPEGTALLIDRLRRLPPLSTLRLTAHYGAPIEDYLAAVAVDFSEAI